MRLLGLDVGDVRVGVAVSDPTGMLVEPREAVRAGTRAGAIEQIAALVEREEIGEVVVGMPVSLDGGVGRQGEKTKVICGVVGETDFNTGADVGRELFVAGGGWDYEGVWGEEGEEEGEARLGGGGGDLGRVSQGTRRGAELLTTR